MESPYKKKSIKKHKPRPFKEIMQNSKLDQSKPMEVDKTQDCYDNYNDNMDIDYYYINNI
jgi:hypothetical protein